MSDKVVVTKSKLGDIAQAIRDKFVSKDYFTPDDMVTWINKLSVSRSYPYDCKPHFTSVGDWSGYSEGAKYFYQNTFGSDANMEHLTPIKEPIMLLPGERVVFHANSGARNKYEGYKIYVVELTGGRVIHGEWDSGTTWFDTSPDYQFNKVFDLGNWLINVQNGDGQWVPDSNWITYANTTTNPMFVHADFSTKPSAVWTQEMIANFQQQNDIEIYIVRDESFEIVSQPGNIGGNDGDEITLSCYATGNNVSYEWVQHSSGMWNHVSDESSITFTLSSSTSGTYHCNITNYNDALVTNDIEVSIIDGSGGGGEGGGGGETGGGDTATYNDEVYDKATFYNDGFDTYSNWCSYTSESTGGYVQAPQTDTILITNIKHPIVVHPGETFVFSICQPCTFQVQNIYVLHKSSDPRAPWVGNANWGNPAPILLRYMIKDEESGGFGQNQNFNGSGKWIPDGTRDWVRKNTYDYDLYFVLFLKHDSTSNKMTATNTAQIASGEYVTCAVYPSDVDYSALRDRTNDFMHPAFYEAPLVRRGASESITYATRAFPRIGPPVESLEKCKVWLRYMPDMSDPTKNVFYNAPYYISSYGIVDDGDGNSHTHRWWSNQQYPCIINVKTPAQITMTFEGTTVTGDFKIPGLYFFRIQNFYTTSTGAQGEVWAVQPDGYTEVLMAEQTS